MFESIDKKLGEMGDKVSHYDIYTYEGWTLQEVQDPMTDHVYDREKMKWVRAEGKLKTTIVWGLHQKCGKRGFIVVTTGKVYCNRCKEVMPPEVYNHMVDSMSMLKGTLDDNPSGTLDF